MPTFQVINRKRNIVLGEVSIGDRATILDEIAAATGTSVEEIIASLGKTADEAKAALDIVELPEAKRPAGKKRTVIDSLPRRRLFA